MTKTLFSLVKQECCNFESDECLGVDLYGKRFKDEGGVCWIKDGNPCDFFTKCVLPLAPELTEKYRKVTKDVSVQAKEVKRCNCGRKIDINERKCTICKVKAKRHRNRRYRLKTVRRKKTLTI